MHGPPSERLKPLEAAALFVGTILVLTPLIGLALNYPPLNIVSSPALASPSLLLVALALIAIVLRRHAKAEGLPREGSGNRLRPMLYAVLPVVIAMALRLYPYLISGLPFSVDSWPSIRYAELLLGEQPIRVGEAGALGKSPDYFGEKLFGAVASALTGLQPMHAMAFLVPLVGALSTPMLYAIARGLYGREVASLASLFSAVALSDVILTAGVKGETYAHPLYLFLVYLLIDERPSWRAKVPLFALASASLVTIHYYTAILTTAILASTSLGIVIVGARQGASPRLRDLSLPVILACSTLIYFVVYARWAFDFISTIDLLSAASFQVIAFSSALWLAFKDFGRREIVALSLFIALAATSLSWLSTVRPLALGAPVLPTRYLLYAGPLVVAAPLCALGYDEVKRSRGSRHLLPLFWLAPVLGLESYAVLGNVDPGLGSTLAYRGLNFLVPPVAILSALGVRWLYERGWRGTSRRALRGLSKAGAIAIALFILLANVYGVYACVNLQERYLGYFWLYTQPEFRAASWVKDFMSNATMAGDVKALYLLKYYFGVEVDVLEGLKYLSGRAKGPRALFVYEQMARNGYVVWGGYSVDLPSDWVERARSLNLVYSNGAASVYVK
ncbi:MAG: hypothetical protein HA491_01590 [Candidatus Verstraetearchaeota archaeon]|nr:hypothetical protein [Candidatus Verstraetearchaeota archaeon]